MHSSYDLQHDVLCILDVTRHVDIAGGLATSTLGYMDAESSFEPSVYIHRLHEIQSQKTVIFLDMRRFVHFSPLLTG